VGLGPFPGLLAIGFCGFFFVDDMEGTEKGPAESMTATGAHKIDVVTCATIPAAAPAFDSTSIYAPEKAVRPSTVLGLVGAGNIGIELNVGCDLFDYPTAITMILMIPFVVIAIKHLGGWAHAKIIAHNLRDKITTGRLQS